MTILNDAAREAHSVAANETNPIGDMTAFLARVDRTMGTLSLSDPRVVRIERLRLIGYHRRDYPRWDVSYCYGALADGRLVRVDLGTTTVRGRWASDLVNICKDAGRYGKALGIFAAVSTLPG